MQKTLQGITSYLVCRLHRYLSELFSEHLNLSNDMFLVQFDAKSMLRMCIASIGVKKAKIFVKS